MFEALEQPVRSLELAVLDYECTGTVPGYPDEPWQVGVVLLRGGKVDFDSRFESLLRVDAARPFNPHAPGRHARLRDELAAAPSPSEVWPQLLPWLSSRPLCAHNAATEKKWVRAMAPMHPFGPWVDTLKIARKVWPGLSSYALGDLVRVLGLSNRLESVFPGRRAHDALYDAAAAALLLEHLLRQPGWEDVALEVLLAL